MTKAFDVFKKDFYDWWGIASRKSNLVRPYAVRKLKMDNIDGRKWNDCKHLNKNK